MLGRDYLARQARTLLKLARITRDPNLAASLAVKASDLKARLDATPPDQPEQREPDASPRSPDADPLAKR